MIKLDAVSLCIGDTSILSEVHLSILPGEFVVVIGPNGAGKSSLLKVIAGDIVASTGAITIDGRPWSELSPLVRATRMGRVYQDPSAGTVEDLTVRENIALALYRGRRVGLSRYDFEVDTSTLCTRVRKLFGDPKVLDIKVKRLSGGQRQMLAFLMATAYPVDLLLLDEPMAALDYRSAESMKELIKQFASSQKNHAIVLVTHDLKLACQLGTVLWIVREGKVSSMLGGSKKESLTPSDLEVLMYGSE